MNVSKKVTFRILNKDIYFGEIIEKYYGLTLENKTEIAKIIHNWKNLPDDTEIKLIFISADGKTFNRTIEIII